MSDNGITQDQFQHIAKLSRLSLGIDDQAIAGQLSEAAKYVEVLNELNIDNVNPTSQVNHKKNVFRQDEIEPSFTQKQALSQAPKIHLGFFVTEATIKK